MERRVLRRERWGLRRVEVEEEEEEGDFCWRRVLSVSRG